MQVSCRHLLLFSSYRQECVKNVCHRECVAVTGGPIAQPPCTESRKILALLVTCPPLLIPHLKPLSCVGAEKLLYL